MNQERVKEMENKIRELIREDEDMIAEIKKQNESEDDEIWQRQNLQNHNYHAGRREGLKLALAVVLANKYYYKLGLHKGDN